MADWTTVWYLSAVKINYWRCDRLELAPEHHRDDASFGQEALPNIRHTPLHLNSHGHHTHNGLDIQKLDILCAFHNFSWTFKTNLLKLLLFSKQINSAWDLMVGTADISICLYMNNYIVIHNRKHLCNNCAISAVKKNHEELKYMDGHCRFQNICRDEELTVLGAILIFWEGTD
jgi:hypothetical protein